MTLPLLAPVPLLAPETHPETHPEIGTAVGTVHGVGPGWIEVAWPRLRSWHKEGDVVPVEGGPK